MIFAYRLAARADCTTCPTTPIGSIERMGRRRRRLVPHRATNRRDERASFFQAAYSSAPAMVVDAVGAGFEYPIATARRTAICPMAATVYRLHLPPGIPAKPSGDHTLQSGGRHDARNGPRPSRRATNSTTSRRSPDGSVELFFGPTRPANAPPERNWIQTLPDRAFMVAIRLYGATAAFYDQSWKPDDVVPAWLGSTVRRHAIEPKGQGLDHASSCRPT